MLCDSMINRAFQLWNGGSVGVCNSIQASDGLTLNKLNRYLDMLHAALPEILVAHPTRPSPILSILLFILSIPIDLVRCRAFVALNPGLIFPKHKQSLNPPPPYRLTNSIYLTLLGNDFNHLFISKPFVVLICLLKK